MRLCLVEDMAASGLEPLTLTRPVQELLLGATTLGSKLARAFGVGPGPQRRSCMIRPLPGGGASLIATRTAVVNDRDWLARGPVIVANSRWVPPADFRMPDEPGAWVGLCDGSAGLRAGRSRGRRLASSRRGSTRGSIGSRREHDGRGGRRRVDRPALGPRRAKWRLPGARLRRVGRRPGCRTGT